MTNKEIQKLFVGINENKYKKALKIFHNTFNVDKNFVLSCLKHCKDNDSKRNLINQYRLLMVYLNAKIFVGPESDAIFIIYPKEGVYALKINSNINSPQLIFSYSKKTDSEKPIFSLPDKETFEMIYPSKKYTLFLTSNKTLYGHKKKLEKIELGGFYIKKICTLTDHFVILTYSKEIIIFDIKKFKGVNLANYGGLEDEDKPSEGLVIFENDDDERDIKQDRLFTKYEEIGNIIDIVGYGHIFVLLTEDNKIWMIDLNQESIKKYTNNMFSNIKKIGYIGSIIVLTNDNKLYRVNRDGKFEGFEDEDKDKYHVFTNFFCAPKKFIAVTKDQRVFVYGHNYSNEFYKFEDSKNFLNLKSFNKYENIEYFHDNFVKKGKIKEIDYIYTNLTEHKLLRGIKHFHMTENVIYYVTDEGFVVRLGSPNDCFSIDESCPVDSMMEKTNFKQIKIERDEFKEKMRGKKAKGLHDMVVKTDY
jgi:hypothetical protein